MPNSMRSRKGFTGDPPDILESSCHWLEEEVCLIGSRHTTSSELGAAVSKFELKTRRLCDTKETEWSHTQGLLVHYSVGGFA